MEELVGQILARPTPKASTFRQMSAIAAWHGPRRLAGIACPTTVVHGDVDPLMPVGNGMRLARAHPGRATSSWPASATSRRSRRATPSPRSSRTA